MARRVESTKSAISIREVERVIHVIRGQRVLLDSDLARFYGLTTRRLNEQVSRNSKRFPEDFAFQLSQQEFTALMSQIATSKVGRGGRRKLPWAFTEHGVAMLSSVLRSPTAANVNIEIIRAFFRMRRLMATPGDLVEQIARLAESVQIDDEQITAITRILQRMMTPPPDAPKGRIGFRTHQPGEAG